MKKLPTVPNLALKALEIISTSKQKLYVRNQNELKLLVIKNPDYISFILKVEKTSFQLQLHFFLFISPLGKKIPAFVY